MPKYAGRNGLIYVNGSNVSGQSNKWALDPKQNNADSSCFGDQWDTNDPVTNSWSGSFSGFADPDGSAGVYDALFDLLGTGPHDLLIYPRGSAAGNKLEGQFNVEGAPIDGDRGGLLGFNCQMKGTGELTNTAVS